MKVQYKQKQSWLMKTHAKGNRGCSLGRRKMNTKRSNKDITRTWVNLNNTDCRMQSQYLMGLNIEREITYKTTTAYKPKGDKPSMYLGAGVVLSHFRL